MAKNKIIKCPVCKRIVQHCAKGLCKACYQRTAAPKITCVVCKRERPHHAKGMCSSCYMKILYYDNIRKSNVWRYHKISLEDWDSITQKCILCGFDKIVELHHLDENKSNNQKKNLIGLCPNHHRMLHIEKYKKEIIDEIKKILKEN